MWTFDTRGDTQMKLWDLRGPFCNEGRIIWQNLHFDDANFYNAH